MTTLQEARQQEGEWSIAAKLASKLVFVKRDERSFKMALILVFIDCEGQQFEIKTWSTRDVDRRAKIFTVYRKVHVNECYEISSRTLAQFFRSPNVKFSTSKLEFSRGWWLDPIEPLRINRYMDCSTNIQNSLTAMQHRPVNLLGSFVKYKKGPPTNLVQGYFVALSDDEGRMFAALVWHAIRIDKNKFPLFHAERGDTVLIIAARPGNSVPEWDMPVVTTVYQPVVNSKCVSPKRINALKHKQKAIAG